MNLHNARFRLTNIAIWVGAVGMQNRSLGTHLWQMEEGEPPEFADNRRGTNLAYWTPARFAWQPYQNSTWELMRQGWVRPLCGKTSASRRPRARLSDWAGCRNCARIAGERGIVGLTYTQTQQNSPTFTALQAEMVEWRAAGRPSTWPQEPAN